MFFPREVVVCASRQFPPSPFLCSVHYHHHHHQQNRTMQPSLTGHKSSSFFHTRTSMATAAAAVPLLKRKENFPLFPRREMVCCTADIKKDLPPLADSRMCRIPLSEVNGFLFESPPIPHSPLLEMYRVYSGDQ